MQLESKEELQMIAGCRKGNRKSQELLFRSYGPAMHGICYRYLFKMPEDVQDVMQDSFIKIFLNFNSFKGAASLQTWMTGIMIRCCLDHLRKHKYLAGKYFTSDMEERSEGNAHLMVLGAEEEEDGDESFMQFTAEEALEAMNELPEKDALIMNLYVVDGYTHKEISELLAIAIGTSKARLFRARKKLVELLLTKKKSYENTQHAR